MASSPRTYRYRPVVARGEHHVEFEEPDPAARSTRVPEDMQQVDAARFRSPPVRRASPTPTPFLRARRAKPGRGGGAPLCGGSTAPWASRTCRWALIASRPSSSTPPSTGPATPATRCLTPSTRRGAGRRRMRARRCVQARPTRCRVSALTRGAEGGREQDDSLCAAGAARAAGVVRGVVEGPFPSPARHVAGRAAPGRAWLPHQQGAAAGGPARGAGAGPERPRPTVRA